MIIKKIGKVIVDLSKKPDEFGAIELNGREIEGDSGKELASHAMTKAHKRLRAELYPEHAEAMSDTPRYETVTDIIADRDRLKAELAAARGEILFLCEILEHHRIEIDYSKKRTPALDAKEKP